MNFETMSWHIIKLSIKVSNFMQFVFMVRDCSSIYVEKSKLDNIMEEVTCTMLTLSLHFVAQMNVPYPGSLHSWFVHAHFLEPLHHSYKHIFLIPNSSTYGYKILCKTLMLFLMHSLLPCSFLVLLYFHKSF